MVHLSLGLVRQTLLQLSPSELTSSDIKQHLAQRLLRSHGELVVSVGQRRDSAKRFHAEGALSDDEVGTIGQPLELTNGDTPQTALDRIQATLKQAVNEIGGEVSQTCLSDETGCHPYPMVMWTSSSCPVLTTLGPSSLDLGARQLSNPIASLHLLDSLSTDIDRADHRGQNRRRRQRRRGKVIHPRCPHPRGA